jgi:uncharacterized protein (TIGR02147 family)
MNESVFEFDDYRAFLRTSLKAMAQKNPVNSLRSFARKTSISPSHLSRALSGKKKLSASSVHLISESLGLSANETNHLLALVELEKAKEGDKRNRIIRILKKQARGKTKTVSLETFQVVADWYHFAILALTNTRGFQSRTDWISRRLGLGVWDARIAIERMLKLGLLIETKNGWKAVNEAEISTTDDLQSSAIQENHRQHLKLAEKALLAYAPELREFNNLTLSMNLRDLPKAKKKIRDFVSQFNQDLERNEGDEVFQLNVQLLPLSLRKKGTS